MARPRHESAGVADVIRTVQGVVWRQECACGQRFTGQTQDDVGRQLVQHIRYWAMSQRDPGHVARASDMRR